MRVLIIPVVSAALACAGCLHDTNIALHNDSPRMRDDSIKAEILYPDSLVGNFFVWDPNKEPVGIIPASWPGEIRWNEAGDSATLYLPGDSLGDFRGSLMLIDRRGKKDSVPYAITRVLKGFGNPDSTRDWLSYYTSIAPSNLRAGLNQAVTATDLEMRIPDSSWENPVASHLSNFGLRGDITVEATFIGDGEAIQKAGFRTLELLLAARADSRVTLIESAGLAWVQKANRDYASPHIFGIPPGAPIQASYPFRFRIERIKEVYRVLGGDTASTFKDTLLSRIEERVDPDHQVVYPVLRYSGSSESRSSKAYVRDFLISRGRLIR